MKDFKKTVLIGKGEFGNIFVTIQFKNKNLSITGVEGPMANGDCTGSCGQMVESIRQYINTEKLVVDKNLTIDHVQLLVNYWNEYHLNDMKAECDHQRELGWNKRRIDETKPLGTYGLHFQGQRMASLNMLGWVKETEHPNGLLGKACPICGYKYGTAWNRVEVPESVLGFFAGLVETDDKVGKWW